MLLERRLEIMKKFKRNEFDYFSNEIHYLENYKNSQKIMKFIMKITVLITLVTFL
jgi:hypothetical protein